MAVPVSDYAVTAPWAGVRGKPDYFATKPSLIAQEGAENGDYLVWNEALQIWEPSAVAPGAVDWGDIGGTLSAQADLQAALDLKADISSLAPVAFSGVYADLTGKPTGLPPTGAAGGGLGGTYPNPSVTPAAGLDTTALHGNVGTAGNYQRVTTQADGRVTAGFNDWINAKNASYGAIGNGSTDDAAALAMAALACRPNGGIDRVIPTAFGTGYTSAPTVGFLGGTGSGAAATALVADTGANGELGTVVLTTRGTGYTTYAKTCGVTSASDTVTCADTSNLVAGLSVSHYAIPAGTYIKAGSIVANTSFKLVDAANVAVNATATNAFAAVVFGIPVVTFTGGAGAGAAAVSVIGNGNVLFIPPGDYRMTYGLELTGFHNLDVIANGATFFIDNKDSTGLIVDEFSRGVRIYGLKIVHFAAVFGNSATRDVGCGVRAAGDMVEFHGCSVHNSPEFGILFGRDRNTGSAMFGCRLINWKSQQTCGDGVHVSNGCGGLQMSDIACIGCGDDCIGIVADYGAGNEPSNITLNGYNLQKGGWRGIAVLGAKNVQIGGGQISYMDGYGIQVDRSPDTTTNAVNVNIQMFSILYIGQGGAGAPTTLRDGIVVGYCVGGKLGPGFINTTTDYGYYVDNCTDFQIDLIMVMNAASGDFVIGATNTRLSHLYRAAGALKYRGDAGTITTLGAS